MQELTSGARCWSTRSSSSRGGKLVSTEADAFWLPDTPGTDYRRQHTKTTIGIRRYRSRARDARLLSQRGLPPLEGDGLRALFRLDAPPDPAFMPLFAELVRTRRVMRLEEQELVRRSLSLLKKHVERRPRENPIRRFARDFAADIESLTQRGLGAYHTYAFATIPAVGSAFELGAEYLRWLGARGVADVDASAAVFDAISTTSKSLILKAARAVGRRRPSTSRRCSRTSRGTGTRVWGSSRRASTWACRRRTRPADGAHRDVCPRRPRHGMGDGRDRLERG